MKANSSTSGSYLKIPFTKLMEHNYLPGATTTKLYIGARYKIEHIIGLAEERNITDLEDKI